MEWGGRSEAAAQTHASTQLAGVEAPGEAVVSALGMAGGTCNPGHRGRVKQPVRLTNGKSYRGAVSIFRKQRTLERSDAKWIPGLDPDVVLSVHGDGDHSGLKVV